MTDSIPSNKIVPSFEFLHEAYRNYFERKDEYDLVIGNRGEDLSWMLIPQESMDSMFKYGVKQSRKRNKNFSKHLLQRRAILHEDINFTLDQMMTYPNFTRYMAGEGF